MFLTGQAEIDKAVRTLNDAVRSLPAGAAPPLLVLPLYASLPPDMQLRVFRQGPEGARRCIVATNVAETSITVEGVVYVVDSGVVKQKHYHPATGMDSLDIVPISRVQATQRTGRAGRTRPGKVCGCVVGHGGGPCVQWFGPRAMHLCCRVRDLHTQTIHPCFAPAHLLHAPSAIACTPSSTLSAPWPTSLLLRSSAPASPAWCCTSSHSTWPLTCWPLTTSIAPRPGHSRCVTVWVWVGGWRPGGLHLNSLSLGL